MKPSGARREPRDGRTLQLRQRDDPVDLEPALARTDLDQPRLRDLAVDRADHLDPVLGEQLRGGLAGALTEHRQGRVLGREDRDRHLDVHVVGALRGHHRQLVDRQRPGHRCGHHERQPLDVAVLDVLDQAVQERRRDDCRRSSAHARSGGGCARRGRAAARRSAAALRTRCARSCQRDRRLRTRPRAVPRRCPARSLAAGSAAPVRYANGSRTVIGRYTNSGFGASSFTAIRSPARSRSASAPSSPATPPPAISTLNVSGAAVMLGSLSLQRS